MAIRRITTIVSLFLLSGPALAAEMELVRDGKSLAYLVVEPNAHALVKEAAADLQWAVKQASGATLKQVTRQDAGANMADLAGLKPVLLGITIDLHQTPEGVHALPDPPYDQAVIREEGAGIAILGTTPAGVANGVATVLLEDFGVRTYYPDPLFTIVPKASSLTIKTPGAAPAFRYRVWSGVTGRDVAGYVRRNRLTDQRVPVPHYGFGHNLATIIPATLGKEHPEYLALRDGKRQVHGRDAGDTPQPCFTHPDVVARTIAAARAFFDANPKRDTFPLCVNDNPFYCECEKCAALDKPYRDLPVGRQYSESYFAYVSKVADAIHESHPGRYLGVFAYWNVEQPPRDRPHLPENVVVALTLDVLQHYDPAYRDKDRALVKAWAGKTRHLHTYIYYGLGWYTPRTSPRLVAEDLRFCRSAGVQAIYCEAYPFWAWCGPMDYVAARLQWDPSADVGRIIDEFHRDCFGDVAAEVKAFHEACERYWTRPRAARWFEGLDQLEPEAAMADLTLLREAGEHLDRAIAQTRDPLVRERLAWLKKGYTFTAAIGEAFAAKKAVAGQADAVERWLAVANAVEAAYLPLSTDPAYVHSYYEPAYRFNNKCWGWFKSPMLTAAQTRWDQMRAGLTPVDAKARWQEFQTQSGLKTWLDKRKWDLQLKP